MSQILEAFQELQGLKEATFSFNKPGILDLQSFLDDSFEPDGVVVIDASADDEAQLQDTYNDEITLKCCVCGGLICKPISEVVIDPETQRANVNEECPCCYNTGGYKVVGEFNSPENVEVEETEEVVGPNDEDMVVDVDDITVESNNDKVERFKEALKKRRAKKIDEAKEPEDLWYEIYDKIDYMANEHHNKRAKKAPIPKEIEATLGVDKKTNGIKVNCATKDDVEKVTKMLDKYTSKGVTYKTGEDKYSKKYPLFIIINIPEEELEESKDKDLNESISNIQVTTDSDIMNIDLDGSDSVNVNVQPNETPDSDELGTIDDVIDADEVDTAESEIEEISEDDLTIEPVDDETKAAIMSNTEDSEEEEVEEEEIKEEEITDSNDDEDIEEFDEEEFDELGESYLKENYDNIRSYKTIKGYLNEGKMKFEGIITFNSGKQAKTSFLFENYSITPKGKLKLIGENLQLTNNKKAFILTGNVNNKKLVLESLTYNYNAKDAKTGKTTRIFGSQKINK